MRAVGRVLLASLALAIASLAIHVAGAGLLGLLGRRPASRALEVPRGAPRPGPSERVASVPEEPRALPPPPSQELVREVRAGRLLLGEALIARARLGAPRSEAVTHDYRLLLAELRRRLPKRTAEIAPSLVGLLRERGLDAYKALHHDLGNELLHRGGDCRARAELVVALLYDAGYRAETGARVFANHVAPIFHDGRREHRFGLVAQCTGLGTKIGPFDLLESDLPASSDRCRDERPLLGAGLGDADPEPSWSGEEPPGDTPCPLADWPWLETGDEVFLLGVRARWEPLHRIDASRSKLEEHAAGLECHSRTVTEVSRKPKSADRVLATLGRAVAYGEQSELFFTAAGEHESAQWVEARTREWYRQADEMLARWDPKGFALRAEHASLIHLGPRGQAVLLGIVPRHLCWVGSDLLAMLVHEPATRDRAMNLYLTRTRPQQIEAADRMYWTDDEFQQTVARHPAGRRALLLRAAVAMARARWKTCSFEDLVASVRVTAEEFVLEPEWSAPLVAVLAEDARVHLGDHRCNLGAFTRRVQSWAVDQPGEIQSWLERQSKER